jgi:ATP-binding cassette subfamily F protein 3
VVYENLHLRVERGQRIVLVGPNGAGKSTLLKIIADLVPIQAGERTPGHNVGIGYFAQHRTEALDLRKTVLDEVQNLPRHVPEQAARNVLGSFLFRGDDVFKPVSVLSGGEKSRLALVKLLLDPPNLLLLDEPTTHLDMPSIDALIKALGPYDGTLVFVSHDVHFIRALATSVIHVQSGHLTPYAGNYDYYLEKSRAVGARAGTVASLSNFQPAAAPQDVRDTPAMGMKEIRAQRKAEAEARQAANRERRQKEQEVKRLEEEIQRLEERQRELTAVLEDPATYDDPSKAMETNRQLSGVSDALDAATAAWEKAAEVLADDQ